MEITLRNGFPTNGISTNGILRGGFLRNGTSTNGTLRDGFLKDGILTNGTSTNGILRNGTRNGIPCAHLFISNSQRTSKGNFASLRTFVLKSYGGDDPQGFSCLTPEIKKRQRSFDFDETFLKSF